MSLTSKRQITACSRLSFKLRYDVAVILQTSDQDDFPLRPTATLFQLLEETGKTMILEAKSKFRDYQGMSDAGKQGAKQTFVERYKALIEQLSATLGYRSTGFDSFVLTLDGTLTECCDIVLAALSGSARAPPADWVATVTAVEATLLPARTHTSHHVSGHVVDWRTVHKLP